MGLREAESETRMTPRSHCPNKGNKASILGPDSQSLKLRHSEKRAVWKPRHHSLTWIPPELRTQSRLSEALFCPDELGQGAVTFVQPWLGGFLLYVDPILTRNPWRSLDPNGKIGHGVLRGFHKGGEALGLPWA